MWPARRVGGRDIVAVDAAVGQVEHEGFGRIAENDCEFR
jgi:hypothetical protein